MVVHPDVPSKDPTTGAPFSSVLNVNDRFWNCFNDRITMFILTLSELSLVIALHALLHEYLFDEILLMHCLTMVSTIIRGVFQQKNTHGPD